jgi:hypothetical protein
MKAKEIRDAILSNIKVSVKKTGDSKGNDNSRQYKENPNENDISLFPLRLEYFIVTVSFSLPKNVENKYRYGLDKQDIIYKLVVNRRTPLTKEQAELFEEIIEQKFEE